MSQPEKSPRSCDKTCEALSDSVAVGMKLNRLTSVMTLRRLAVDAARSDDALRGDVNASSTLGRQRSDDLLNESFA